MANAVSITLRFDSPESTEKAFAITEEMIKLLYLPKELPWAAEAEQIAPLSRRCALFGEAAAALDPLPEHPYCSLKRLSRTQDSIVIARCADIQSPVDIFRPGDFYTQLCVCLARAIPDARFSAVCRHEETVSATVQLNRILCDHGRLSYEEMWILDEDEDADEDDWSRACRFPLRDDDGIVLRPAGKGSA